MKWWDQMPWSSFSEYWALSQLFHSTLSLSSRGFLVPLITQHNVLLMKMLFLGSVLMTIIVRNLAWKLPCTVEPGRLQSMGSLRVTFEWATSLSLFTFMHWRRKWQPTPVFLPGESQRRRSPMGCRLWGAQSRTRLKRLNSSSSTCEGLFLIVCVNFWTNENKAN